jgi:hypothetical protein
MRNELTLTTSGAGAVTGETNFIEDSILYAIRIDGRNLDNNATLVVNMVTPGDVEIEELLSVTLTPVGFHTFYVRVLEQGADGADLATTNPPIINGMLQYVVASGGATNDVKFIAHLTQL